MRQSTLTVNLHRPQIQSVRVQEETGSAVVGLGNDEQLHGTVDVFFEDLDAVQEFIQTLTIKVGNLKAERDDKTYLAEVLAV